MMKETKIFVDTSHGRVLHGTLTGSVFQRRFANNGVRYSDKTLPINPQCIGQLFALGCETLEYTVDYMGSTIKYTLPFSLKLKEKYGIETNEHGDKDIRIPLEDWNQEVIEMKAVLVSQPPQSKEDLTLFGSVPSIKRKTGKKRIDRCPY